MNTLQLMGFLDIYDVGNCAGRQSLAKKKIFFFDIISEESTDDYLGDGGKWQNSFLYALFPFVQICKSNKIYFVVKL